MTTGLEELLTIVQDEKAQRVNFPEDEEAILSFVYAYAKKKHEGQTRHTGEPYIVHPEGVAKKLLELGKKYLHICAGMIHDVVEEQRDDFVKLYKETYGREPQEEEIHSKQGQLFLELREDLFGLYETELVIPLLGGEKKASCREIINNCCRQLEESYAAYDTEAREKASRVIAAEFAKPESLWKDDASLGRIAKKKYLAEQRKIKQKAYGNVQRFLMNTYQLAPEESGPIVKHTDGILSLISLSQLMTHDKELSFFRYVERGITHRDADMREGWILIKLCDSFNNTLDMIVIAGDAHSNSDRIRRCAKNIFLLNCVKEYFIQENVPKDNAAYKLFLETCRKTFEALTQAALQAGGKIGELAGKRDWLLADYEMRGGIEKVTLPQELDSPFDGIILRYNHYMQDHKSEQAEHHKDVVNQYDDAIALRLAVKTLAMKDNYTIRNFQLLKRKDLNSVI